MEGGQQRQRVVENKGTDDESGRKKVDRPESLVFHGQNRYLKEVKEGASLSKTDGDDKGVLRIPTTAPVRGKAVIVIFLLI